jgi:hypothetical protein
MVVPEVLVVGKRPDWAEKTSTDLSDLSIPRDEATKTRAYEPPVDVSTTGHGGESLPQETTPPEPKKVGFLNGVGAGLGDLVDDFWSFIPLTPSWSRNVVDMVDQMKTAYEQGDIIDALNVVNPLIGIAHISLAMDNDDWYTVGQAAVGVGVAILSVVIAKKVPKIGNGASNKALSHQSTTRPRRPRLETMKQADRAATGSDGVTRCHYCRKGVIDEPGFPNSKEYDHTLPYVREGGSGPDNIKVTCRTCNRSKGAKTPEEWRGPQMKE